MASARRCRPWEHRQVSTQARRSAVTRPFPKVAIRSDTWITASPSFGPWPSASGRHMAGSREFYLSNVGPAHGHHDVHTPLRGRASCMSVPQSLREHMHR